MISVKEGMTMDWEPWQALQRKSNHVVVKLLFLAIFVVLSFRLLFSLFDEFRPVPVSPADMAAREAPAESMVADVLGLGDDINGRASSTNSGSTINEEHVVSKQDRCDLFTGQWIPNPSGPRYTNESCRFIEPPQNCMKNGRPDTEYLFWRWKPNDCDVSPFDAKRFLDTMKNKNWALVGDSILRNQVQSLICLLSKVEEPVEVDHDEQYKSRRWHFHSHNFNISLIWSPFLIKAEIFENDEGVSKSESRLHIDTLDHKWTSLYNSFDYVVISGGQWFLKSAIYVENNKVVGCHYCPKLNLSEISLEYAYNRVLNAIYSFIKTSEHKPIVIYRTWTPQHFEHGEWFSGGLCNRTEPYKAVESGGRDVDNFMRAIELNAFARAVAAEDTRSGARLKLLDTFQLAVLRPDAHPGPYRAFHPFEHGKTVKVQYDCLHWCLPGAIDVWNDLMIKLVMDK
ncbi:hypothetical protein ZIOFF_053681 [Zingiber officinale]|uniref:Trichome birefringence-like N-terminal domain-containing protein n=2 Tax=Zingiber officinale TaxID=94328 RepID=A0A8J5FJ54_ZINOF|nr:hypothetical protein ZIOFF_053681 [Zingiber officinale]